MASTSTSNKKNSTKNDCNEQSSTQRLLASLAVAQNRPTTSENVAPKPKEENKKSRPKKTKPANETQAPEPPKANQNNSRKKGGSVGARMQQQGNQNQPRRQRAVSTSKPQAQPQSLPPKYIGPRIPVDVLDHLEFKFVSNLPEADRSNSIRVCFELELAHWYYIDHIHEVGERADCPNIGIKDFTRLMFNHCEELNRFSHNVEAALIEWRDYKATVPTYGAILVDPTLEYVILVQSYFAKNNSWGFPKGKINQNEPPRECAIRETFEEVGFDFGRVSKTEKKFQHFFNDQMVRLYVVLDVPHEFKFSPQTRKEIRKIEWFKISDLPSCKNDRLPKHLQGHKFYMVIPFVDDIRRYTDKLKKTRALQASSTPRKHSEKYASTINPIPPPIAPIFSHFFPNAMINQPSTSYTTPGKPPYKYEAPQFRPQVQQPNVSRPILPEMTANVGGMNVLETLGLCTPLRPGASINQFSLIPQQKYPIIAETEQEMGFAMPTALEEPMVTSEHPWNSKRKDSAHVLPPNEEMKSHEGWLGSQLVNTIMHSPIPQPSSCESPATPTNRPLGHLIGKPIQPQPIVPVAASARELGSAEKPKRSSRISLSDNSAFSVSAVKTSSAKATAPPISDKKRSESMARGDSRGSIGTPQSGHRNEKRSTRNLFNSITSPGSSGMRSLHANSQSSLGASEELEMYNRETPINLRYQYMIPSLGYIPPSNQWNMPLQLNKEFILGCEEYWRQKFSTRR